MTTIELPSYLDKSESVSARFDNRNSKILRPVFAKIEIEQPFSVTD